MVLQRNLRTVLWYGWWLLAWPFAAQGTEVSMAFGEKIPPFCFPETNSGIEIEIIREALAFRGHTLKPAYFPFARIPYAFKTGSVDAAMSDLGEDMSTVKAYYGDPAVFYDNVFITLKQRRLAIHAPSDLHGLTVVAFPGALKRYPMWLADVKKEGGYFEQNNQSLQVLTLSAGRYDVVLSDRYIFRYFTNLLKNNKNVRLRSVELHSFVKFNPMDYRPLFHDEAVRNDFNIGLKQLKKSGRLDAIYKKYLGALKDAEE